MKSVFVKDGAVIGYGTALAEGVSVSTNETGALEYKLPLDSPVEVGWHCTLIDENPTFGAPPAAAPKVSPVQFKLLFTVTERVAIKASDDKLVQDFFEIVNDPRLTFVDLGLESTQQALQYLATKALIAPGRPAQILTGVNL